MGTLCGERLPSQYRGTYIKGRQKPLQPLWTPIRPVYWTLYRDSSIRPMCLPPSQHTTSQDLLFGPWVALYDQLEPLYDHAVGTPTTKEHPPLTRPVGGPCTTIIKTESIMSFEHHRSSSSGTYPYITLCIFNVRTITLLQ